MVDITAQTSPLAWNSTGLTAANTSSPEQAKTVAKQFEALLIGQIMKSMREAGGGGWLGTGEDQSGSAMCDLAEQQFAQMIASQGGFGLAAVIEEGFAAQQAQPQKLSEETSSPAA